jgi:O-antigen/teichoic acid export membrane protein
MSNTKTIAKNSVWYGLDTVISAVVALVTSIAVARTLGPTKTAYIIYVSYIASVVGSLGGVGIPATTRKYMAEYLGMGDLGTARYIYLRTLLLQMAMATLATVAILFWVVADAGPEYKWTAILIVLSIWPSMVNSISAQANVASENLRTNLPASLVSTVVYFVLIMAAVVLHWGVVGIGAALLAMRLVDFVLRLIPTMGRIYGWEKRHVQLPGLRRRMLSFAWQGVITMILSLIVWDRSEVVLLKHLCADIRQVAFYSVAFSLAERLLLGTTIFASATSTTVFAQYGRDKEKLPLLAATTLRYLALIAVPIHLIAFSLAVPALLFLYGSKFAGAAAVAMVAPLLCMFKAFIDPPTSLLQSHERQSFVIFSTILAGIIDLGLTWSLAAKYGAVGACIGNGAAQLSAVLILWVVAIRLYKVKLPWKFLGKLTLASMMASLAAYCVAARLTPFWALLCGGSAALIVLLGLFCLMRILEPQDGKRLSVLVRMLPKSVAVWAVRLQSLLIRPEAAF